MTRCAWPGESPLHIGYHDTEWGVPSHDDTHLFEMLILEGAQAGLSWDTILKKRETYRAAYRDWAVARVAGFGEGDVQRLLADPGIVRNRAKVAASILNAQATLRVQAEFGSLDAYLWGFVGGRPVQNAWTSIQELPAESPLSKALSKDLLKRGFKFVGPTIVYAFMQAVGMVNDHEIGCFRHAECARLG